MKNKYIKTLIILFLSTISIQFCFPQTRYYVSETGSPTGNALSWATACSDLQLIINNSSANDTIWVKQGTYAPIRPANNLNTIDSNNRDNAFVINDNIHLYGGFTGTESQLSQRILPHLGTINGSILSGDIGILNDSTDNAFHVVIIVKMNNITSILDGFSITGGNTDAFFSNNSITVNGISIMRGYGGGVCIHNSNIILNNFNIIGNTADANGGGIHITLSPSGFSYYANIVLNNTHIAYNRTNSTSPSQGGGGIHIHGIHPSYSFNVIFNNVTITHNHSNGAGGGAYVTSRIWFNRVNITYNTAGYGGGLFSVNSSYFSNVLIANNMATDAGGAVYNRDPGWDTSYFTNVTICKNKSPLGSIYCNNNARNYNFF